MKKLLLLTWYENNNYGTSLQAYSLKTVLENPSCTGLVNGNECYENVECTILRHKPEKNAPKLGKLKKIFSINAYLNKFEQIQDKKIRDMNKDKFDVRAKAFEEFNKNYFVFNSDVDIQCPTELNKVAEDYDIVLSGSDQIWNPEALDPTYLLEWVPNDKKIMSYGSSLSIRHIPSNFHQLYKRALSRFDCISIRDVACREQLSEIVGKDILTVVDPVVLLGKDELLSCSYKSKINYSNEEYIFCYFLGNNKEYRDFALQYAKKNNLKIKAIINTGSSYASDKKLEDYAIWDVGPWEFLNLIKNAKFVITDSFHATVVSTLFKSQFAVFEKDSSRPEQNNRIKEFLTCTGLDSRWGYNNAESLGLISETQWDLAHKSLDKKRLESLEYIIEALC